MKYSLRSQLILSIAIVAFLLGVVTDRAYLSVTPHMPDPRLIGVWAGEDGKLSFRTDGNYEAAFVVTATANGNITKTKQTVRLTPPCEGHGRATRHWPSKPAECR
jgi:hypothetical protein